MKCLSSKSLSWIGGLLAVLLLAGCQTVNEEAGTGFLSLPADMTEYVQTYLEEGTPGALAFSLDGHCASYRYCPAAYGSCPEENSAYFAVQGCESRCDRKCKVLMVGREVVWNGPVIGLPESIRRPQDQTATNEYQSSVRSRLTLSNRPNYRVTPPIGQAKKCPDPDAKLFDGEPGPEFRDCPECPEMVTVPGGKYVVGSIVNEREWPPHEVEFAKPFAVGKYEVTFEEWDTCVADGGCNGYSPPDGGKGRGRRPVIKVSWHHAKAYVRWLSRKTGSEYRLPSEAEWEYVARAGSCTKFWWGDDIGIANAVCGDCRSQKVTLSGTAPVGQFKPNAFGLYDTAGNVLEWVEDCQHSYELAKKDGSATTEGICDQRAARGGSFGQNSWQLRPESRLFLTADRPTLFTGFRVAKTVR